MNDEHLIRRLKTSNPILAFPPDFEREIWSRVEASERPGASSSFFSAWQNLLAWIARPLPATCMAILMGATGCLFASIYGHRQSRLSAESLYVRSVSPFAAVKSVAK